MTKHKTTGARAAWWLSALLVGCGGTTNDVDVDDGGLGVVVEPAETGGGFASAPDFFVNYIDDMEDGDNVIIPADGRQGLWSAFTDGVAVILSVGIAPGGPGGSAYAIQLTASAGYQDYGAGLAVDLKNFAGIRQPYNASGYSGVTFLARVNAGAPTGVRVEVADQYTDAAGGLCTVCGDHFGADVNLTGEWQRVLVPWSALQQEGFGDPRVAPDTAALLSIVIRSATGEVVDIWVDELAFFYSSDFGSDPGVRPVGTGGGATGGAGPGTGGAPTGGATPTGGAMLTGGMVTGGAPATGGLATGGAVTGGAPATGGAATGGAATGGIDVTLPGFGNPAQVGSGTTSDRYWKSNVARDGTNYFFMANGWGPGFASQTVSWQGTSFTVVSMQGSQGGNYEPASYPTMFCGVYSDSQSAACGLPAAISSIGTLATGWRWNKGGNNGQYNAAYDIWLGNGTSVSSHSSYLMVWLRDPPGQQPAGSLVVHNQSIPGVPETWDIWTGNVGGRPIVNYVRDEGYDLAEIEFDVMRFYDDAISRGYSLPGSHILSVAVGFEIWNGPVSNLRTEDFYVQVN